MLSAKQKIIVICGPTGVGKTAAAITICRMLNGQIVSADSMQIYRFMDIGTAKPTPQEQRRVRHHLIDVVDPDQDFDAARYARSARKIIADLHHRRIVPLVVGGSGLYIKALLHGVFPVGNRSKVLRTELKDRLHREGAPRLHRMLAACDPEAARRIHPNDSLRILRALEVFQLTGRPLSELHKRHGFREKRYAVLKIGLALDRDKLYARIDARVEQMIARGLEAEVRGLLDRGYGAHLKSMQSIGYRHMVDAIQGRTDYNEALRTMKRDTRRYAKRQLTWFNADADITWTQPHSLDELLPQIMAFLEADAYDAPPFTRRLK